MRVTCYRCFWPQALCWCSSITPMATRTRFVFLMHPKEFKQEKAATGRLTHLCLATSELHMGVGFDEHERVQELIRDSKNFPVLLYPGRDAINLSGCTSATSGGLEMGQSESCAESGVSSPSRLRELDLHADGRQLVVFLLDATWALGRKMLKLSPTLQRLPRIMFTPTAPSRYLIKHQPHQGCLSTLEATHELLLVLTRLGLDRYPLPDQLLQLFHRMQDFQLRCAADPARSGYRRRAYKAPAERAAFSGRSGTRRSGVFQAPGELADCGSRIADWKTSDASGLESAIRNPQSKFPFTSPPASPAPAESGPAHPETADA